MLQLAKIKRFSEFLLLTISRINRAAVKLAILPTSRLVCFTRRPSQVDLFFGGDVSCQLTPYRFETILKRSLWAFRLRTVIFIPAFI